ncbi:hypothetical protein D7Z54_28635 [Salibacterium salarium]|uniref:Uncharacterized protein n=1 Tax=Salibacterium salarium TaxID=284579 RepID=A0A3R9QGC4_9BACI|nr:hypothetical protein [Salibacterium salarium]RSL29907.1 hypothetical protein D7Z54_28635 [Salibacterium salarium]
MVSNMIRVGLLVISWISIIFLPKRSYREYLPVSLFCSLLVICGCFLSYRYKWWKVKGGIRELIFMDSSFIFGPFLAGTLWIFDLTFGNFKHYVLLNLFANLSLSYPLTYFFEKYNVYKLVNFKRRHLFLFYYGFAFIIYGYQLLIERSKKIFAWSFAKK